MKTTFYMLSIIFLIGACKNDNQKEVNKHNNQDQEEKIRTKTEDKAVNEGTYLCKINGKDWAYTKASGIVSRHKKTGKRTAIITFKKQLEKGSESVQLYYDSDSFELESASLQLKFPKKGGTLMTGFYDLFPDTRDKNPESDMSGTLDLSNPTTASGTAELIKFNMKYEKGLLENPKDAVVTVSDLNFSGVGYSDIDKLFKQ